MVAIFRLILLMILGAMHLAQAEDYFPLITKPFSPNWPPGPQIGPVYFAKPFALPNGGGALGVGTHKGKGLGLNNWNLLPTTSEEITQAGTILAVQEAVFNWTVINPPPPQLVPSITRDSRFLVIGTDQHLMLLEDVFFNRSRPTGAPPTFIYRLELFTPSQKSAIGAAIGISWAPSDFCDLDNDGVADEVLVGGSNGKMIVAKLRWGPDLNVPAPILSSASSASDTRVSAYNTNSFVVGETMAKPTCSAMDTATNVIAIGFKSGTVLAFSYARSTSSWTLLQRHVVDYQEFVYQDPAFLGASAQDNLFAGPAWVDMDNDNKPDSLAIGFKNGAMIMMFHGLSNGNATGCPIPPVCGLGSFQLGCGCLPCPAGTYRAIPTQAWCQVCGSVDYYCPEGSSYPQTRLSSECSYWAPYPSASNPNIQSPDFFKDIVYYTEKFGAFGGAKVLLLDGTEVNVNSYWTPGSMQQEMWGGMKPWRNRVVTCGAVSLPNIYWEDVPNANQTSGIVTAPIMTRPADGFLDFFLQNTGSLPVNVSFSFAGTNIFFATVLDTASQPITKYSIGPGTQNHRFRLKVQTGNVPGIMLDVDNKMDLTLQINSEPYWKQQVGFESEALPPVYLTFQLQFEDATVLAVPNMLAVEMQTNSVQEALVQLFSLGETAVTVTAEVPAEVTFVTVELLGGNEIGSISKCEMQASVCSSVDQSIGDFSRTLKVTFNTNGLFNGQYRTDVIVNVNGNLMFIGCSLVVRGGLVNWGRSTIHFMDPTTLQLVPFSTTPVFKVDQLIQLAIVARDNLGNPTDNFFAEGTGGNANMIQLLVEFAYDNSTTPCPINQPNACFGSLFAQPLGQIGHFTARIQAPARGRYNISVRYSDDTPVADGAIVNTETLPNPMSVDVQARACTDANAVSNAAGTACRCKPGYGSRTGANEALTDVVCSVCTKGTFSTEQDDACKPCPEGTYQDETGQTQCKRCDSLIRNPSTTKDSCVACSTFEYVREDDDEWRCRGCGENQRVRIVRDERGTILEFAHPHDANLTLNHYRCACNANMYYSPRKDTCLPCPDGGFCVDRDEDTILPRLGYWGPIFPEGDRGTVTTAAPTTGPTESRTRRVLQNTTTTLVDWVPYFLKCRRAESCPGVNLEDSQLSVDESIFAALEAYAAIANSSSCTVCEEGFTGPLCFKCAGGFTRAGVDSCTKCLAKEAVVGLLILGAIFAIIVCVYIIRRTLASMNREDEQAEEMILLRVLMSHLQSESMVQGIDLDWPPFVMNMYEIFNLISSTGQSAFSLDCFVDPEHVDESNCNALTDNRLRTFFLSALFVALLPVLGLIISTSYWVGRFLYIKSTTGKGRGRSFYQYNLVSVIIIVFLLYPSLVRTGFKFFSCSKESINGHRFVEADFNIICWSPEHLAWALTLGLIIIFVYALGVPIGFLYILKTRRADSHRYGKVFTFLYTGFKPDRYYWEVVIMFRKLGIAACSIMLKPYGSDIQAFATAAVVFLAICVQLHIRPYISDDMNFVEVFGLVTVYLTLFLGLFQSSANINFGIESVTNVLFGVIIVLINVAFLSFIFGKLFLVTYRAGKTVGFVGAILLLFGLHPGGKPTKDGRESSALSVVDSGKMEAGNPIVSKELSSSVMPMYEDVYKKNGQAHSGAKVDDVEFARPV